MKELAEAREAAEAERDRAVQRHAALKAQIAQLEARWRDIADDPWHGVPGSRDAMRLCADDLAAVIAEAQT